MSDNEERSFVAPEESAPAPNPASAATEKDGHATAKPATRTSGLIFDALVLGWIFARGFLLKPSAPAPDLTPDGIPTAAPDRAPQKTGRAADRMLDPELNLRRRETWGTLFVICAFAAGVVGGAGFVFAYWAHSDNWVLGAAMALFLGAFGAGLVLYSQWLMPHKEAVEPRETLQSGPAEREAAVEDYCAGADTVQRRGLLKWMGAAVAAILAAMVVSLLRSLGMSPYPSLFTPVWKRGERLVTADGKAVSISSLDTGSTVTVFPEGSLGSERAQTVLIRVREQLLHLPEDRASWAPMGYVAYSRVCTHAGCPVGLFEAETHQLLCPCHQSTFDVLRSAAPTGGPAARPLPQLPLYADSDGNLRAAGGFTEPPGPGFWGMS